MTQTKSRNSKVCYTVSGVSWRLGSPLLKEWGLCFHREWGLSYTGSRGLWYTKSGGLVKFLFAVFIQNIPSVTSWISSRQQKNLVTGIDSVLI